MRAFLTWVLSLLYAPLWPPQPTIRDDWRGLPEPNWACRRWGVDYL